MALRKAGQVKTFTGTTEISLEAKADQSFIVRDVLVEAPTGTHVTLKTGRATVGYFRVSGALGNHLAYPPGGGNADRGAGTSLLSMLGSMAIFRGYPVPAGMTFTGSGAAVAGCIQSVIYDEFDPGDIRADQPNGPDSNELDYIVYGNTGGTISTATTSEYDTVVNPAEFIPFPFGKVVPGNTNITCYGVLASTFSPSENDGSDQISTSYLKFTKDRRVLFDPDLNGITFWDTLATQSADQVGDGQSPIGNYNDIDNRLPLFFDPPLENVEGTELLIHVSTQIAGSAKNYLVADQEVGLIMRSVRS